MTVIFTKTINSDDFSKKQSFNSFVFCILQYDMESQGIEKELFGVVQKLAKNESVEDFATILFEKNREWKFTLERVSLFPSFYSGDAINEKPLECKSLGGIRVSNKLKDSILWCRNHNWTLEPPEDGENMWRCTTCGVYCHHDTSGVPVTFERYRMCTSCTGIFHECVCGDATTTEGKTKR
jgi:hypothetical protein